MRRTGRLWIVASVLAAVVVACALVALSLSGGSSGSGGDVTRAAAEARSLLAGLPQRGTALGRASAPVTVTEFVDLQCPICREAAVALLPHVVMRWIRPGSVRLVIRPIAFIGPDSERGAVATEAAAAQGRAWTLADTLYRIQGEENSGWLNDAVVDEAARATGLNVGEFDRARAGGAARAALKANTSTFAAIGGSETPTFVVAGPLGRQGFAACRPPGTSTMSWRRRLRRG